MRYLSILAFVATGCTSKVDFRQSGPTAVLPPEILSAGQVPVRDQVSRKGSVRVSELIDALGDGYYLEQDDFRPLVAATRYGVAKGTLPLRAPDGRIGTLPLAEVDKAKANGYVVLDLAHYQAATAEEAQAHAAEQMKIQINAWVWQNATVEQLHKISKN